MAWPRAPCAETSSSPSTQTSARLGGIQSPEILEHEPPLLRREPGQLVPRRIAQPGTRARRAGFEYCRKVHAVVGGGATGALLALVGLAPRQGPAGVEQPAVQALLTLDRLLVETARVELARQLARFLRERARRGAPALRLQPFELLRECALARRDRAQLLEHRLPARAHHGQEPARLPVQPLLVARHPGELLDRFGEPAPRLRARDLAAAPREGERRGVEGIDRLFRQRRGLTGVGVPLLELLARRRHLALGKPERPLELRRDERMFPRRLADLPLHGRRPLLHRRLARPRDGAALAAAQRFGHLLLAVGQRRRLGQRAVERAERLLTPRSRERVASGPQRVGKPRKLLLCRLARPLRSGLVALPRRLGGALHGGERLLELAESLLELGRDGALQQLLHLTQPRLERRVVDPRRLRGARDLLDRFGQLLHTLRERLLLARHRLRPLGRLKRQRAGLRARRRPARASRGLVARTLLRQVAGALAQVAL